MAEVMGHFAKVAYRQRQEAKATIEENKEETARRLLERTPVSREEGAVGVDFVLPQDDLQRWLDKGFGIVYPLDKDLNGALRRRHKVVEEATNDAGVLDLELRFQRNGVKLHYGDAGLRELGMKERPSRERLLVLDQAKKSRERMDSPEGRELTPLEGRKAIDFEEYKARLDPLIAKLEASNAKAARRKKEVAAKRLALEEGVDEQRLLYNAVVGIQTRLYRLAGFGELARRLRPVRRRRRSSGGDTPEPPEQAADQEPQVVSQETAD